MSGEEFLKRHDAGQFARTPDDEATATRLLAMYVNIGR